jgi:ligand-binding sensor domain-containing protein/two-component sensor histidine kinase
MPSAKAYIRVGLCLIAIRALAPSPGKAEQLPLRAYGPAEGFPSKTVEVIIRDSRGFLWFATREGLVQFDGYEFRTYNKTSGLPRNPVADFLETRSGIYYAATPEGLAKFEPNGPPGHKFTLYRPEQPEPPAGVSLYEDHAGRVWYGTEDGLYLIQQTSDKRGWRIQPASLIAEGTHATIRGMIQSLFEDSGGNLWIGTMRALYVRRPNGRVSRYQPAQFEGADFQWNAVFEDSQGRLWAGTGSGLWRILPAESGEYKLAPVYVPERRLIVWSIVAHPAGGLWLATSSGLMHWTPNADGLSGDKRLYTRANGLSFADIGALATDREGNLWIGTNGSGVMRLARNGFVTYNEVDGINLGKHGEPTVFRDLSGEVHTAFHQEISVRRGERFIAITPALPGGPNAYPGWAWHQSILRDHTGEWWFATGTGLVRFPNVPVEALSHTRPKAIYTIRDGLRTNDIFRIFEDSSGGIWIACIGPSSGNGLTRWDRRTGSFEHFSAHTITVAMSFAEDRDHSIWIGYYDGALGHYVNGAFTFYTSQDGLAGGGIQSVHIDRAGRLWIASNRGLTRVDSIVKGRPQFLRFGTPDGLSSNVVLCLAEDAQGRIYLATGVGVDRIEATGLISPARVRHYTEADGLTKGELVDMMIDGHGDLWCTSRVGISRLTPEPDFARTPPPMLIRGLRIRGVPYRLSDLGESRFANLTLAPDQNQIQFDFSTLAFAAGEPIKYQYRLDPLDSVWSDPSDQRTINFSHVAPGSYRFSARMVTSGGVEVQPATVDFVVLAPLWQRWWFRLTAVSLIFAIVLWLHHYRTLRVVELERVRTRIATDLHDDIGSGLSQIAVLSEVARAEAAGKTNLQSALSNIANVSRELTESMSDIVWSVNPSRDRLPDLTQRMRRFASDVLSGGNTEFRFLAPASQHAILLPADVRREVFLIFKEAVNNLVRHSGCSRAEIEISFGGGYLTLRVDDNGSGFAERFHGDGHGLRNMSERAKRIGGSFSVKESALGGVGVLLKVPIHTSLFGNRIPT